jgi:hypothetical protein
MVRFPTRITALAGLLLLALAVPCRASGPEEFFETRVRPVLVKHCHSCHSARAKKKRGGLLLDSRKALLAGGDSGPALDLTQPEKSRLLEAVRYANVDLQMPPRGKLPASTVADLTAWVKQGAPWPEEKVAARAGREEKFDLLKRKREHWAWRPVKAPAVPVVKNGKWPSSSIDRFLLARLEEKGLSPAGPAGRATLLRRLFFDLIGLPPTPSEMESFLSDRSPDALSKQVDRLLDTPAYGERWARHWLDLVRYAETRGHEFDAVLPNAYQYRDYVIRALNADIPYNQFVLEHIAGDLLPHPRLNPREKFNESILGTGFWFLGEEVHSPVDIRGDQADRFDNRIDVMSKTFLGLTVGCARCHDHKFDAISTKDYYALFGFLASSSYRLARFDSLEHNREIAAKIAQARQKARPALQRILAERLAPGAARTADYLLAAREALRSARVVTPGADVVFEDFESGTYDKWEVTGTAFGTKPQTLATIAPYQGRINAKGRFFVNSHNVRNGENVAQGDAHTGRMVSRAFTVSHDWITLLVGGGAHKDKTCVNLVVAGKAVLSATGRNNNQMFPVRWDVRRWRGQVARIHLIDEATGGWGNIGVDHIVFTNNPGDGSAAPPALGPPSIALARAGHGLGPERVEALARKRNLDARRLSAWVAHLLAAARDAGDPLHPWARLSVSDRSPHPRSVGEVLRPLAQEGRRRQSLAANALTGARVVVDYGLLSAGHWLPDDVTFGPGPVRPGELRLVGVAGDPVIEFVDHPPAAVLDPVWNGMRLSAGSQNDPGALGEMARAGRTIRTPTFHLKRDKVFYLVRGAGMAYAAVGAHVMIAGPLHGRLVRRLPAGKGFHWVEHDLKPYKGQNLHLEFTAAEGGDFAVGLVVQADLAPGPIEDSGANLMRLLSCATSPEELARGYQRLFLDTTRRLAGDRIRGRGDSREQARLASWLVRKGALFGLDDPELTAKRKQEAGRIRAEEAGLAAKIRRESRLALAMRDGTGVDEQVFIRGSHKALGEVVPRRFLEALAGPEALPVSRGSGRLELARLMTDPGKNPFLARVMVNRVWQHLFGRGIVASVDNFGVLGERPTHPDLLDHLADRFVKDGWSVKKLIRRIVLSRAYRMSSARGPGDKADPGNLLLHRMRVRRLEGEAIRDALLAVSGRLDRKMFGPSVAVHLTAFQDGRGRPASGPVDGEGRRSIYLAVRRNFLSPMLLAFDTPSPFSTVGRRTISNVPAQSLILMNDPFVHQQARVWARRVLAGRKSDAERIQEMYLSAFARKASEKEQQACLDFLRGRKGAEDTWTDLAHALMNVKEFIFLP